MLKKLLLAGSIAALSAVSAHAQLNITNVSFADTPALELELAPMPATTYTFNSSATLNASTTNANFPTGTAYLVSVILPAGVTFGTVAQAGDLTASGGSQNVTVSTGGAVGDSQVTYLVTTTNEPSLTFSGNYRLDACVAPNANITMTAVIDGSQTPISGGTATSTTPMINPCSSALDSSVAADSQGDTIISLSSNFLNLTDSAGSAGTVGPFNIADLSFTRNTAVTINGITPTPISAADVSSVSFDVDFVNIDGVTSVDLASGSSATIVGNTASFNVTNSTEIASLISGVTAVTVTVDGTTAIESQALSVSNAVIAFNDSNAELITSEPGATGPIDDLLREGQNFGPFDWNDGRAGRTTSVYRVTGFNPGEVVDYTVTLTNSNRDGSFTGTLTADAVGEFTMTSVGFGGVVGTYGRGDVSFNFERNGDLDVDRLMARNGISTSFGGGANSDAEED